MKKIPLYEVRPISNLREMLASSVELFADKPAFMSKKKDIEGYYPITYRQFGNDVNAFGTALASMGLTDSRIAVIGENKYEWSITYLSVVNGLGTIVPIDKELPQNEMESLLARARVDAVISAGSKRDEI
jgi:long-chain acyl-CoA synthetase